MQTRSLSYEGLYLERNGLDSINCKPWILLAKEDRGNFELGELLAPVNDSSLFLNKKSGEVFSLLKKSIAS